MTEIETTIPGRRITAGPTELRIENTNTGGMIWANLLGDDAKKVADALLGRKPGDEYVDWKAMYKQALRERDALDSRLTRVDMESAEAAEKRHTWPKTTPTGHTYIAPDTYAALCHQHGNAVQAAIESWEADECPPEPTWEMVGIAHREVERLQRERDRWKAATKRALEHRDEWKARADQLRDERDEALSAGLEALGPAESKVRVLEGERATQPAPAVSIADIQKVVADVEMVRQTHGFNPPATRESELVRRLWALHEGTDQEAKR